MKHLKIYCRNNFVAWLSSAPNLLDQSTWEVSTFKDDAIELPDEAAERVLSVARANSPDNALDYQLEDVAL